ncbi:GIY-YIG nuclease family protein [Arthrobacter sp. A5]|uniref:GIY-YIG nuclease family protein n=1 Tax=Arthrobacter sp. A5 TaxID=576926 RepID=UPI003DA889D6
MHILWMERAKSSIEKLGKSMAIEITDDYHQLRLDELKLTADYHVKVANEREAQRTLREEAREQEKVEKELQKAREKVEQERSKYQAALAIAIENGEPEAIATMQQFVADADAKLHDLENRQANVRTGYIYVISNLGAFGDRIVKIGMTRRLEPTERIRELSGAGVPFLYDVHVLFFSEDAAALEAQLHREFEAKRVNKVNLRREFFYATPAEVKEAVNRLVGVTTLEFKEESEASEFRLSLSLSKGK